jgi:SAM-dependent methyltransferase
VNRLSGFIDSISSHISRRLSFFPKRHHYDHSSLVLDIGGVGKQSARSTPGFQGARLTTLNLGEAADISDDARTLTKIEDQSLDGIYSSHLLEHFSWWETEDVLKAWRRKLKPHGRVEIRCPDMEWIFKQWFKVMKNGHSDEFKHVWDDIALHNTYGAVEPWHAANQEEGYRHRNLLTQARLSSALKSAGFTNVRRLRYGKHLVDQWTYDLRYPKYHGKITIRDLVVEGYKA